MQDRDEALVGRVRQLANSLPSGAVDVDTTLALGEKRRSRQRTQQAAVGFVGCLAVTAAAFAIAPKFADVGGGVERTVVQPAGRGPLGEQCEVPELKGTTQRQWSKSSSISSTRASIDQKLGGRYGANSKADPAHSLQQGLFGIAHNYAAKQIVVVVDPAKIDARELKSFLSEGLDEKAKDSVAVASGCHSSDALLGARDFIEGRSWVSDKSAVSVSYALNPSFARFDVTASDRQSTLSLEEALGELVSTKVARIALAIPDRRADPDQTASE